MTASSEYSCTDIHTERGVNAEFIGKIPILPNFRAGRERRKALIFNGFWRLDVYASCEYILSG